MAPAINVCIGISGKVINMKSQYVFIFNSIGYGVRVQFLLKNVFGGFVWRLLTFNGPIGGIFFKNRCTRKSKKLSFREKINDSFMVISKLRAVTFIKNEHNAFIG